MQTAPTEDYFPFLYLKKEADSAFEKSYNLYTTRRVDECPNTIYN
jgi:hypothetical protein